MRQYQVIKQADIVLATFMLRDEFSTEQMAAAFDYYEPKTLHVSSLSWNTHAMVAARIGRPEQAYEYYQKSAGLDLDDIKGATGDGLHAAALGGCWQAVVLGMAGLRVDDGRLSCDPKLPREWDAVRFRVGFRGAMHEVVANRDGSWQVKRD
jgi:trehalose/maltose hydrolase-like predicted phosphorylase